MARPPAASNAAASPATAPHTPGEAPVEGQRRALRPKDAATLVLVDRSGPVPRILMGRRRATQVFLPNKFVFPGGRVDAADRAMPALGELPAIDRERLLFDMKGTPSPARVRALALAAIRETFEEVGLVLGKPLSQPDPAEPGAGRLPPVTPPRHDTWQRFYQCGCLPTLTGLSFLARAITPPARPRRYDTRFFMADADGLSATAAAPDDELRDIGWFTLDEIRALDLPNITRAIVEDLAQRLAAPHRPGTTLADSPGPIPYYRFERGTFRRDLIT